VIDISFEEGEKVGYEKGEKVGYDKGREENAREMAKTMKNEGEPIEKISRYTNLSKEEIQKL
jgi:predicted transposase/invertase (TIGR01784 family)